MAPQLSGPWAIIINIIAWFCIHLGVSVFFSMRNPTGFHPEAWLYREREWERNGIIYSTLFRVKKWKGLLPDGAAVARNGFRKKKLESCDAEYLHRFIQETCRAEITHWAIFAFSVVFFIWNVWWIGIIMVIYALLVNTPCIIAQRYNRMRLKRLLVGGNKPYPVSTIDNKYCQQS